MSKQISHTITDSQGNTRVVDLTVDDGDHSLDVESMVASAEAGSDVAYRSDLPLRMAEELEYAYLEILEYASQDTEGRWTPDLVQSFEDLAVTMAKSSGRSVDDILYRMQEQVRSAKFDARSKNPSVKAASPVIGTCSLDTSPTGPFVQNWSHPSALQIIFMEIRPGSAAYRAPEYDDDGLLVRAGRTAMAVAFQPELNAEGFAVNPYRSASGRWLCDDSFLPGYSGVVRWFGSLREADEALADLNRAVVTVGKASQYASSREHDTVQACHDDPDDSVERAAKAEAERRAADLAF